MPTPFHFKKIGDQGPTILMLHGWKHSHLNLLPLAKILSKDFQVYIPDLPGFGSTPILSGDPSTSDYVEQVKFFIESQQITPYLIGHSFGGRLSVKLAALYPDLLLERMILIGTPGFPQRKNFWQTCRLKILKVLARFLKTLDRFLKTKTFVKFFVPRFGSADYQQAGDLRNLLVKTVNENLAEFASKIRLKTLLLWGAQDQQAGLEQAEAYLSLIPDAELRILAHHGHEPFADVGAHYCAKIIRSFFIQR